MAGLYLHFPFCQRKCAYCDFYSIQTDHDLIFDFLDAVTQEASLYGHQISSRKSKMKTIYMGGGSPSLLRPADIQRLLQHFSRTFTISAEPEITIEVNPGTVTTELLNDYMSIGINRISIGVQSFNDDELRMMGRVHSARVAEDFVIASKQTGFKSVGVDLIYGLPNQNIETWKETLHTALNLAPHHISTYNLTWSTSTALGRKIQTGKYPRPDEKTITEMYLLTHEMLCESGYEHYEISNYAFPSHRCCHNEGYWTGQWYLGLGPSAHSFLGGKRFWNVSDVRQYMTVLSHNQLPVENREVLNEDQKNLERMTLGLRTLEGISLRRLRGKEAKISSLIQEGLAVIKDGFISLTPKGFLLADEITLFFFAG